MKAIVKYGVAKQITITVLKTPYMHESHIDIILKLREYVSAEGSRYMKKVRKSLSYKLQFGVFNGLQFSHFVTNIVPQAGWAICTRFYM